MNLVLYNLIYLICFFPIWLFAFPLDINVILITLVIIVIGVFFHNIINKYIKSKILSNAYLALVLAFGIDNCMSIFSDFLIPNGSNFLPINVYLIGFVFLLIFFVINLFLLKKTNCKSVFIILSFIIASSIYSLKFSDKNFENFPDFKKNIANYKYEKMTLVLVMDQMAGINSDASKSELGKKFDENALIFAKKYGAKIYENIYTQCPMTYQSIPKLINFDYAKNCVEVENLNYTEKSNNFFNEYSILKNRFFDKFNSIAVLQSYYMNYCNNENVKICDQYSQFKKYDYVKGFKDTSLSKILGAWKHHGSILGNISWRAFLTLNLSDSYEQSGGEKGSFVSLLKKIEKKLITQNHDLIFVHSLSTHSPYGFNDKCEYSGKRYINYSLNDQLEAIKGQNYDRICILKFLDSFFERLAEKKLLNNIEFIILSDHGTRLQPDKDSTFKTIFIHKDFYAKFEKVEEIKILQKTFSKLMN